MPALRALVEWMAASKTRYLIIGGVAVALLGRARSTLDVDVVVLTDEDAICNFLESGAAFGFRSRVPDPIAFAQKARILLLVHEPSGTDVDMALGALPFEEECIARSTTRCAEGIELRLPQIEDLIIMKAAAGRELDFADIDTLLKINPEVDVHHIRRWVHSFCEVLDAPETVERVEKLLAARPMPPTERDNRL